MYVSNTWNDNFDDLRFDGDPRLISRQRINFINYDTAEIFNNGSIFDVHKTNLRRIKL